MKLIILSLMLLKFVTSLDYSIDQRMTGGWRASITAYPHAVQLIERTFNGVESVWGHLCGGSIISKLWILTAAHCIDGYKNKNIRVVFGVELFPDRPEQSITRNVAKMIKHEDFGSIPYKNDIALIKVDTEIPVTNKSKEIKLITKYENITNRYTITTGFRVINESNYLVANNVKIILNIFCGPNFQSFPEESICGTWAAMEMNCYGDSGSGLISFREPDDVKILVGIVSASDSLDRTRMTGECVSDGHSNVGYTRVSFYLDWIMQKILNN